MSADKILFKWPAIDVRVFIQITSPVIIWHWKVQSTSLRAIHSLEQECCHIGPTWTVIVIPSPVVLMCSTSFNYSRLHFFSFSLHFSIPFHIFHSHLLSLSIHLSSHPISPSPSPFSFTSHLLPLSSVTFNPTHFNQGYVYRLIVMQCTA